MSDLSSVTENFFTIASETYSDNLSATIAAGATTVQVNNASTYTQGDIVVLTVEPGTNNEATFIGKKDSGNQFIDCVWTEGNTSVGHDNGVSIVDYDSATHHSAMTKGLLKILKQDGTLRSQPVRDALNLSDASTDGWETLAYTLQINSGYNQGGKKYEVTIPNDDATSTLSEGMRLRVERDTTAPTQCTDLESSSSQYASKASPSGITFTDDFTCEAWVKVESYTSNGTIVSRFSSTGWLMDIQNDGTLRVFISDGTNDRNVKIDTSVPLNKWVHVAISFDASGGNAEAYINGENVTSSIGGSGATSLTQSGDVAIGARSGGSHYFDGKISDVRVWSEIRSATDIGDNMNQQLTGSETNLVGYWKLDGDFTDSTSNSNDLTASGSATATDTDNPMNDTEYAVVESVVYSSPNTTVTVYTGDGYNIPNMTLTSPFYSTQGVPYEMPEELQSPGDKSVIGEKLGIPVAFRATVTGTTGNIVYTGSSITATEDFDLGSNFASNTFTVPYNGVYHFEVIGSISNHAARFVTKITAGGTTVAAGFADAGSSNRDPHINASATVHLNAGDTVTVDFGSETTGQSLVAPSYFSGFLVGRT